MQLERLLRDATCSTKSASKRSQHIVLTNALNTKHGVGSITLKGVEKWFERGNVPSKWLMRIAALRSPALDLTKYA